MEKNKKIKNFGIILLLVLFTFILNFNVNAVGVSSPYWDENPLYLQSGEIKDFSYLLQNMVGNEDIKIKAELEPGTKIMEFLDANTIYDVPFGKSDVPVKMRVSVPENADDGDEFQVGVRFTTITGSKEGAVTIGTAYSKGFRVIVGKPKAKENVSSQATKKGISSQLAGFLILLGILAILILAIRYFHKKRKNKNA